MEHKIEKLNQWFAAQIAACGAAEKELLADDRRDEADFEKIKANVYDIFRTILSAAVKTGDRNEDAVKDFFLQRLQQIPSKWSAAYKKAESNNDAAQMHIERVKLDVAEEVQADFCTIWEDNK